MAIADTQRAQDVGRIILSTAQVAEILKISPRRVLQLASSTNRGLA